MSKKNCHLPDLAKKSFARTNVQTIKQRLAIMQYMLPDIRRIGEICCGDCVAQFQAYQGLPLLEHYQGLDLVPQIIAHNKKHGIDCLHGDALDKQLMKAFVQCELLFFGPPLSVECDGHRLLAFDDVTPGYLDFARLMFHELDFDGTLVAICPKQTSMGDIVSLNSALQKEHNSHRKKINLALIHHSHTTITGSGVPTAPRLKYIELWFSTRLAENWEIRHSGQKQS